MSGLSTVQLGTPYNNMSKKSMNLICHGNFVIASTYTAGEQGCYGNNWMVGVWPHPSYLQGVWLVSLETLY